MLRHCLFGLIVIAGLGVLRAVQLGHPARGELVVPLEHRGVGCAGVVDVSLQAEGPGDELAVAVGQRLGEAVQARAGLGVRGVAVVHAGALVVAVVLEDARGVCEK